ncbi:hypothetical protein Naga_101303g1 [Nannochloropsis gaditana]|uniref:Uncharacterized protein n=1 Tax=Nannochloropsis gaditana TaxID=72520 RepID=W7TCA2_9STRA|nr:hypothetical protein Naga_101303g1 [Nannochloropsis gaditana]
MTGRVFLAQDLATKSASVGEIKPLCPSTIHPIQGLVVLSSLCLCLFLLLFSPVTSFLLLPGGSPGRPYSSSNIPHTRALSAPLRVVRFGQQHQDGAGDMKGRVSHHHDRGEIIMITV